MAVSKYTAKDGKVKWYFSVRYTDWTGERKRKKQEGFKTQREAKEASRRYGLLDGCRVSQFIKATEDDITAKTIFNLFFYSGMREGELLALTLNDFNFENSSVFISKSYAVVRGEQIIKEPKTPKSKRAIALPLPIMEMIKEYASHLYGYTPDQRLFPTAKSSLHRDMLKYCTASGVRKIRIHDLRHSHASMLIEMGISPLQISERLGHEDVQTTLNIYSHLYPNKQEELAEKLAEFII